MSLNTIIKRIRTTPACLVLPPGTPPTLPETHRLTPELEQLYQLCGGMHLFTEAAFPTRIAAPEELVLAKPVIFRGVSPEELYATRDDPSWSWYIIGYGLNDQFISVDLHPATPGLYYNSF